MKTYSGKAKVHDDYATIYKGYTLDIIKLYINYKGGNGMGIYADGSREYRLSLIGTPFVESHNSTNCVIHDSHLDILELNETICLPFDESETNRLIKFIAEDSSRTLEDFIKSETKPSPLPIPDLTTLYSDKEWELKEEAEENNK